MSKEMRNINKKLITVIFIGISCWITHVFCFWDCCQLSWTTKKFYEDGEPKENTTTEKRHFFDTFLSLFFCVSQETSITD